MLGCIGIGLPFPENGIDMVRSRTHRQKRRNKTMKVKRCWGRFILSFVLNLKPLKRYSVRHTTLDLTILRVEPIPGCGLFITYMNVKLLNDRRQSYDGTFILGSVLIGYLIDSK